MKPAACNCIHQTNVELNKRGYKLLTTIQIDHETLEMSVALPIPTERLNDYRTNVKPITLVGAYCPFCGMCQVPGKKVEDKPREP
jgi:hypothetical protein